MAFNPNEPRAPDGKWTGSGTYAEEKQKLRDTRRNSYEDAAKEYEAQSRAETFRRVGLAARAVAEKLGYDPEKITVTGEDKLFSLNGASYHYAGSCDLQTGKITLYEPNLAPSGIPGTTAHEIGHAKFENYLNDYIAERARVMGDPETKTTMKADGLLNEPSASKYPLYQEYEKLFGGNMNRLAKEDGVSNYSRQWWDAVKSGKALWKLGVHETLAEMTRLQYEDSLTRGVAVGEIKAPPTMKDNGFLTVTPSSLWTSIYKAVNDHWDKKYAK